MAQEKTLCFWCGQAGGRELTGYDLCQGCQEHADKGIFLMKARRDRPWFEGQVAMNDGAYPSGEWVVITPESVIELFEGPIVQQVLDEGRAFIDMAAWEKLGLDKLGASHG